MEIKETREVKIKFSAEELVEFCIRTINSCDEKLLHVPDEYLVIHGKDSSIEISYTTTSQGGIKT